MTSPSTIQLLDIKATNVKTAHCQSSCPSRSGMNKNGRLNELSGFAFQEKDHATYNLLQRYVNEQVEGATLSQIIDQVKTVGDNRDGQLTIDKELASRVFEDTTL